MTTPVHNQPKPVGKELLESELARLSGGADCGGNIVIEFPTKRQAAIATQFAFGDHLNKLVNYLIDLTLHAEINPHSNRKFTFLVDQKSLNHIAMNVIIKVLNSLQYERNLVHVLYILRPREKKQLKTLHRMVGQVKLKPEHATCNPPPYPVHLLHEIRDLQKFIDPGQVTKEMGGYMAYNHEAFCNFRISLEEFLGQSEIFLNCLQDVLTKLKSHEQALKPGSSSSSLKKANTEFKTMIASVNDLNLESVESECAAFLSELTHPQNEILYSTIPKAILLPAAVSAVKATQASLHSLGIELTTTWERVRTQSFTASQTTLLQLGDDGSEVSKHSSGSCCSCNCHSKSGSPRWHRSASVHENSLTELKEDDPLAGSHPRGASATTSPRVKRKISENTEQSPAQLANGGHSPRRQNTVSERYLTLPSDPRNGYCYPPAYVPYPPQGRFSYNPWTMPPRSLPPTPLQSPRSSPPYSAHVPGNFRFPQPWSMKKQYSLEDSRLPHQHRSLQMEHVYSRPTLNVPYHHSGPYLEVIEDSHPSQIIKQKSLDASEDSFQKHSSTKHLLMSKKHRQHSVDIDGPSFHMNALQQSLEQADSDNSTPRESSLSSEASAGSSRLVAHQQQPRSRSNHNESARRSAQHYSNIQ